MYRFLPFPVTLRVQVWLLALWLSCSFPSNAAARKRRPRVHHPPDPALTALLPGTVRGGPWTEPTYGDSTDGDSIERDDPTVRRIAIQALGPYHGSVVVVDSSTGRILSILNQRLALASGFQPCSTFKVPVALAALNEKIVEPDIAVVFAGMKMNLTHALAHSNNYFFANLGQELGFDKLSAYARQFGYGEKAGWNIDGEQAGRFPSTPPENGGVGMLASFGEEISQTPLQFAALMSAIANGGTLYQLQYPRSGAAAAAPFSPKVKRKLDMVLPIYGVIPGLLGAVERGTARGARQEEPVAGKTGTCSEDHAHLGWFGAFNLAGRRLVVVILLRGGHPASGPRAASIAGEVYHELRDADYLTSPPVFQPIVTPPQVWSAANFGEVLILLSLAAGIVFILISRRHRHRI